MRPRELVERWRMKRACRQVRREMAWWGHDLSDMTDEEMAEGARRMVNVAAEYGVSVEDAAKAMKAFVKEAGPVLDAALAKAEAEGA